MAAGYEEMVSTSLWWNLSIFISLVSFQLSRIGAGKESVWPSVKVSWGRHMLLWSLLSLNVSQPVGFLELSKSFLCGK